MNNYAHRQVCVPKYGNKKATVEMAGEEKTFDSRKEARRYQYLRFLELGGNISNLKTQVPFELIPAQKDEDGNTIRACKYIADFVYTTKNGKNVVEDVKGYKGGTAYEVFKIKKKLMLQKYGITVREV